MRAAVLVLAAALTYANSLSGAFILDDQSTIVDNPRIREWWRPARVLVPERDTAIAGRPIVHLSFAINYAIGGLDVRGYHVMNIALHVACGLLAFGILRRTLALPRVRDRVGEAGLDVAFAAVLIWIVHPLDSEVVGYLTERTESLMALFNLLTLYASIRAVPPGPSAAKPSRGRTEQSSPRAEPVQIDRRWQGIAIGACAIGMGCKESMVTAPVLVALYDRVFLF